MIVLIGLNILTPWAYKILPNDYVRTGIILEHIKNQNINPCLVIMGNSRGMSGIDANMIEDSTKMISYNYCSPSQSLIESALYYDKLPSSVKYIIQCIDEREFNVAALSLTEPAKLAFSMNNYPIGDFEREILRECDIEDLQQNLFIRNFKARSSFKTGISNMLVRLLDDDAPNDRIKDLKYPYMYPSNKSNTYERDLDMLKKWIPTEDATYKCAVEVENFCHNLSYKMQAKGITIIYVLMPNCPELGWPASATKNYQKMVKETLGSNRVIDCFDLVPAGGFYDPIHPNQEGAEIITQKIISFFKKPDA